MSRILKRPMFRIGGSTNEGIVSMAVPKRAGYQNPTGAATTEDNYLNTQEYKDLLKSAKINEALMSAFAGPGRSQDERLSNLLIRGGLKTMSETPRGGIFATVSKAFQEPVDEYLKSSDAEESFKRQLRLAGLTQAMQSRENKLKYEKEMEVAKMKLYDDQLKLFSATTGLGPAAPEVFNTIQYLKERKIPVVESPVPIKSNGKLDTDAVLNIPKGTRFFDAKGKFWLRTDTGAEEIYGRTGEKIVKPTVEKKPGFFEKYSSSIENYGDNMTDTSIGNMIKKLYTGPDLPLPTNKKITTNYNSGGPVEPVQYDPRSWNKRKFYEELAKKNSTME